MSTQHIGFNDLARFTAGAVPRTRQHEISAHLNVCGICQKRLDQLRTSEVFLTNLDSQRKAYRMKFPEGIDHIVRTKFPKCFSALVLAGQSKKSEVSAPLGPHIPNYRLLRKISRGSFGEVWEAEECLTGDVCAIKVLRKRDKKKSGKYELNGIRQVRKLKHPNLVEIRHVGETTTYWYYAMDLVAETLETRLNQKNRVSAEESSGIITSLLNVLEYCHNNGIAHRDVKPANIGFTSDGRLKLLDLGLVTAANRTDRTLIGTPDYMPYKPAQTPHLDDLYAAGVILHCMLTGNEAATTIAANSVDTTETSPLWSSLYDAVRKATASLPEERFQSAAEFSAAVNRECCVRILSGTRISEGKEKTNMTENSAEIKAQGDEAASLTGSSNSSSSMQTIISQAIGLMREVDFAQRQKSLEAEKQRISRERFKVAVIGQFKTGKSTFINKTLLKEDLLFTDVLEATAIPTEIEYSPAPGMLEIYPWDLQPFEGGSSNVPVTEAPPRRIENPTTDDIKRETSDSTLEGRAAKATQIARARLTWPAQGLRDLIVVDTPGIDSTNPAVVTATYRVVPEADVTLYVTKPTALSLIDLNFLRSHVFDAGISRTMVVINYDPAFGRKSAEQLAQISDSIAAKLAEVGHPNIPVKLLQMDNAAEFEAIFRDFVQRNAASGRAERCRAVIRKQLQQAMAECEVELATLKKSPSEVARIRAEMARKADEFEENYRRLMEGFLLDLTAVQTEHFLAITRSLDEEAEETIAGFEKCQSLKEAQERLGGINSALKLRLEARLLQVSTTIQIRIRDLQDKYRVKVGKALEPLFANVADRLQIDGGVLANVPYWAVMVLDVFLVEMLIPFGWLMDIILRYIASKIPILSKVVPTQIALSIFVGEVRASIQTEFPKMKDQLRVQLKEQYNKLDAQLRANWEASGKEMLAPIVNPLERELAGRNPERQSVIIATREKIQNLLASVK
jgi:serine/threonine protein kinase